MEKAKNINVNRKRHGRVMKNTMFLVILLLVAAGYLFFFTSAQTIPGGNSVTATKMNQPLTFDDQRTVTLTRWDYSPEQSVMEIEMEIENQSFDGLDNYVFTSLSKNLGQSELTVTPIIAAKDFYVIQLADVPSDWKSISLRIKVDDPSKTDILKCYANTESVQTVPELHAKTKNEYLRDRLLRKISEYQTEIETLKSDYELNNQKIAALEDKNHQLEDGKKYQTAEEIEETNREIQSNKNQLEALKTEQENNLTDQAEYEQRIIKTQEQADDLI